MHCGVTSLACTVAHEPVDCWVVASLPAHAGAGAGLNYEYSFVFEMSSLESPPDLFIVT